MITTQQAHEGFTHESHLDAGRWPQLQERGELVPGWVRRGNVVKAVSGKTTLSTYALVKGKAPLPAGFSWTNLDFCGGWTRPWTTTEGDVALQRVRAGQKVCASILASVDGSEPWRPQIDAVRAAVALHPGHTLVERPHRQGIMCWVAPNKTLGEAVDLDPIVAWCEALGYKHARLFFAEDRSLWLPDLADDYDRREPLVTGAILGYPPASTLVVGVDW